MSLSLSLKYLLGKVKSTETIETERTRLLQEYNECVEVENSDDLKEYFRLKEIVDTKDFRDRKKEIQNSSYKGSREYKLEKEYEKLIKNHKLSRYLDTIRSSDFKRFEEILASIDIKLFQKLDEEFKHVKKDLKNADSDASQRFEDYQSLKKNETIIFYSDYLNSSEYKNYQIVKDSDILIQYLELDKKVKTEEFINKKKWLLDPARYEKTEEFQMEQVYNRLKTLPQIVLYLKYQNTNRFDEFKKWKLTFEDDFNSSSLDSNLWSVNNAIPGEPFTAPYSQEDDLQAYTSGKNISLYNSILKLEVKKEDAQGKKLTRDLGFINYDFLYSSDFMHTAKSFKQKYGAFEAKIRIKRARGVTASLFLSSGLVTPHIDLVHVVDKSFGAIAVGDKHDNGLTHFTFPSWGDDKFMIYRLEWTPDNIIWKINDTKVQEVSFNGTQEELFPVLTAMVKSQPSDSDLPFKVEVDWIKCYKKQDNL